MPTSLNNFWSHPDYSVNFWRFYFVTCGAQTYEHDLQYYTEQVSVNNFEKYIFTFTPWPVPKHTRQY